MGDFKDYHATPKEYFEMIKLAKEVAFLIAERKKQNEVDANLDNSLLSILSHIQFVLGCISIPSSDLRECAK